MRTHAHTLVVLAFCVAGCGAAAPLAPPVPAADLLATVAAGKDPILLAMAPDGLRLYAASYDGKLTVIDPNAGTVLATVTISPFSSGIAVAPDGSRVYVANLFGGELAALDTSTNTLSQPVALIANLQRGGYGRIAVAPDGAAVYVANQSNRLVVRTELRSNQPRSLTPDMAPIDLAFVAGGPQMLLAGCKNFCAPGAVLPFASSTGDFGSVAYVGSKPYRVVVSSDGSRAYLANLGGSTVSAIDVASMTQIGQMTVPPVPTSLALTRDGRRLYVASEDSGTVTAIDTASRTVVTSVRVGRGAREVAVSPDGTRVWVSTGAGVVALDAGALGTRG